METAAFRLEGVAESSRSDAVSDFMRSLPLVLHYIQQLKAALFSVE